MDIPTLRESLLESLALVESGDVPFDHIVAEFGIDTSLTFFTGFAPLTLSKMLRREVTPELNFSFTPVNPVSRDAEPGEVPTYDAKELRQYLDEDLGRELRRTFPNLSALHRAYLKTHYPSRFSIVAKDENNKVPFVKSAMKFLDVLMDRSISFSLPGAIGKNHELSADLYYPFFVPGRAQGKFLVNPYARSPAAVKPLTFYNPVLLEAQPCIKRPCYDKFECARIGACLKETRGPDRYSSDDSHLR